jgi:hypothetical protein
MAPCIENVKTNIKHFYEDFVKEMTEKGDDIDALRVKTIVFRDYKPGNEAIKKSVDAMEVDDSWYELPDDTADFEKRLSEIRAAGGVGQDANGLEALYLAMKSDFVMGPHDRQVIVLFADTDTLPLLKRAGCQGYPEGMVDDVAFEDAWFCKSQDPAVKLREKNKRLVIFAPSGTRYEKWKAKLNRSVFEPVAISKGLAEIDFEGIIKILAASASSNS